MELEKVLVKRVSARKYNNMMPDDNAIQREEENPQAARMNENLYWNVGSIIENMELQATARGLASCGINTTVVAMRDKPDVRKALGIPERTVKPELIPVSYIR